VELSKFNAACHGTASVVVATPEERNANATRRVTRRVLGPLLPLHPDALTATG